MKIIPDCLDAKRSESPSSNVARGCARAATALRHTCFTLGPDWTSVVELDPVPPLPPLFSLVLEPGQCSAVQLRKSNALQITPT